MKRFKNEIFYITEDPVKIVKSKRICYKCDFYDCCTSDFLNTPRKFILMGNCVYYRPCILKICI